MELDFRDSLFYKSENSGPYLYVIYFWKFCIRSFLFWVSSWNRVSLYSVSFFEVTPSVVVYFFIIIFWIFFNNFVSALLLLFLSISVKVIRHFRVPELAAGLRLSALICAGSKALTMTIWISLSVSYFTVLLFYCVIILYLIILLCYYFSFFFVFLVLMFSYFTVLLFYCVIILLCYYFTVLLFFCVIILLCYYFSFFCFPCIDVFLSKY